MAVVFRRRLTIPLAAIAFFAVALTAPPAATLFLMPPTIVFAMAAAGIAAIVFLMPGSLPRVRTSRALARVSDGVHSGTDKHQPACHPRDAGNIRSPA
jgi:hypothetical protein